MKASTSSDDEPDKHGDQEERPRVRRGKSATVLPPQCIICKKDTKRVKKGGKWIHEKLSLTQSKTAGK